MERRWNGGRTGVLARMGGGTVAKTRINLKTATCDQPQRIERTPPHYATGLPYVLVNGVLVLKNNEHSGAKAGQALRHVCAAR